MMATPHSVLLRRNFKLKSPSSHSSTPGSSSLLNRLVILHEWWLIKTDLDFQGRRLGVGGFTYQEKLRVRCFITAPVAKKNDCVTLETVDGITVMVYGHLNRSHSLENGFSHKVCDHFAFGFPGDWEEFASMSSFEEEKATPGSEDHRISVLNKIFDDILLQTNDDSAFASIPKKGTSPETVYPTYETSVTDKKKRAYNKRRGIDSNLDVSRLTRSRTWLLDN